MNVLGIDPGIGITGCAIVEEDKGQFSLITSRAITTPPKSPISQRLILIYREILHLIKKERPDVTALETLVFNTNVTTAFSVGQARGVIQLALAQQQIPVVEYNPMQVKMSLTGYGRAEKGQIQQMVKNILKLPKILTPDDVSDAAAIALTHCFSYKLVHKTFNIQHLTK